jgi:hypothetical protein
VHTGQQRDGTRREKSSQGRVNSMVLLPARGRNDVESTATISFVNHRRTYCKAGCRGFPCAM